MQRSIKKGEIITFQCILLNKSHHISKTKEPVSKKIKISFTEERISKLRKWRYVSESFVMYS